MCGSSHTFFLNLIYENLGIKKADFKSALGKYFRC
jgi:hypothetical protein